MMARPPIPYEYLAQVPSFTVTSDDITDGGTLPEAQVYAADNTSPHLSWSGFPADTQGFTVTCYDPDAPTGSGFWHWVLVDIPADVTELATGVATGDLSGLPAGAYHVRNDYGSRDFGGAAPPPKHGPHRYIFTVHALAVPKLDVNPDPSPAYVGFNVNHHTLARAVLIAEYENKG
jgi:hypothetical protein